jgi:hypothetical protein
MLNQSVVLATVSTVRALLSPAARHIRKSGKSNIDEEKSNIDEEKWHCCCTIRMTMIANLTGIKARRGSIQVAGSN